MNFLFRSRWGESLALAWRVLAEGHDARMAICGPQAQCVGDGLVEKCDYDKDAIAWADAVIFDCNDDDMPDEADELMQDGKPCLGSSSLAYDLEKDRPFATEAAKKAGLHIPEWEAFKGARAFEQAAKWMQTRKGGLVFKANVADVGTQVAENPAQMLRLFDYLRARFLHQKKPPDFILQAVIEGTEVSTEAWFDGAGFSLPNATLERNKLMVGDIGEKIGSAGETVWLYDSLDAPLIQQLVVPFADTLKGKYRGPFDINSIIDGMGTPWWLEMTPRFGYGAINCLMELVEDVSGLLFTIASGKPFAGEVKRDTFATGVVVHIPPYPITPKDEDMAHGLPITGWDLDDAESMFHPVEVCFDDKGQPITSGPLGCVCEVVGVADSIAGSAKRAYAELDLLHMPKMRYRNDIGVGAADDYKELERHHLLNTERRTPRRTVPFRELLKRRA